MDDIRSTLNNPENREVTLGMIIEKLDNWESVFAKYILEVDSRLNTAEKRLDEQSQYLFVFKISKCAFEWLDHNGFVKWTFVLICFFVADWISRALFWDVFPKP